MAEENQESGTQGAPSEGQAQFGVRRIYVKDLSFESPMGVDGVKQWQPKVSQDLNTQVDRVADDLFEVVLKLTVTVKNGEEEKTAFLVEVHQAGLFNVSGVEGVQLQHMLTSACPQILFPYAREAVDNMALRGGFPPLVLPPINFDALFAKAMTEAKAREEGEDASPKH